MPCHPLDPLLKPKSIALIGASEREGSPGNYLAKHVINSEYAGHVYPVNPRSETILEKTCYPDLAALPETVDHVVLAVSNERLEETLKSAIDHGARAATIYGNCVLENDSEPPLKQRLKTMANDAGIQIVGGNVMGFYSPMVDLYAGLYPFAGSVPKGGISLIAQSGSAFSAYAHNGCRLQFNLCVSSGDEIATTVSDYMSWSLAQESTRVIGIFLESVRDPEGFIAALTAAADNCIPVVIMKVGKSPLGAAMAHTHTGAVAGDHAAYEALFRKYGVIEVNDFNEMAAVLMMFQNQRNPGPGGLAAMLESGGFREFLADWAHELGIEFGAISESTKAEIQTYLEPGLIAENPLDAWGTTDDFENRLGNCFSALLKDSEVSLGMIVTNFKDHYFLSEALYRNAVRALEETDKLVAIVNCNSDLANDDLARRSGERGIPMIDGAREAMLATRHLFSFRDFTFDNFELDSHQLDNDIVSKWKARLRESPGETLGESDSLALLSDFNVSVPGHALVHDTEELKSAADNIGYPVALKTAAKGIHHKTDHDGVFLNIANETDLLSSYNAISARLGPTVLLSGMVDSGTEVGLGVVNDESFGPFVMVAAGGVLIEIMSDRAVSMAPVSNREADQLISELSIDKLIRGTRGRPPEDRLGLIKIISNISIMAVALKDFIREVDVNPVIVSEKGAVAVDALVLLK